MTSADTVRHRDVLALAVPMIASSLSVPLLGIVDTAVVGHLPGPEYLGAVAVGAVVFSFIFWGFGFLRMSTTGFVAQSFGKKDRTGLARHVGQAGVLAALAAAVLLMFHGPILSLAMLLLDPGPIVGAGARIYFEIRIWAAPATLFNYVIIGTLLGTQNARAPMAIMLTTNLVNAALDVLFVVGFGWGVAGVAAATLGGEYLGLAVGWIILRRHGLASLQGLGLGDLLQWSGLRALLKVNADILIRTLCLIFAFAFFTRQGARMGATLLAANAVLMNFQHFMSYGLDGFAHAAEALVGRYWGAGDRRGLAQAVRRTGQWSLIVASGYALVYAVAGVAIIGLLTDLQEVRDAAGLYLPWLVASPLISVWCFWLDGVFVGATLGREMRNAMALSLLGVFLPVWAMTQAWGNHGLWLALVAFMAARGLAMGWLWQRRAGAATESKPAT